MNIFEKYLKDIKEIINSNFKSLKLNISSNFDGIVFETPPSEFEFDLSSNIALVLAKKIK